MLKSQHIFVLFLVILLILALTIDDCQSFKTKAATRKPRVKRNRTRTTTTRRPPLLPINSDHVSGQWSRIGKRFEPTSLYYNQPSYYYQSDQMSWQSKFLSTLFRWFVFFINKNLVFYFKIKKNKRFFSFKRLVLFPWRRTSFNYEFKENYLQHTLKKKRKQHRTTKYNLSEMEEDVANDQDAITEFATYEDFLDSQISTLDLYYLEVCGSIQNTYGMFYLKFLWKRMKSWHVS